MRLGLRILLSWNFLTSGRSGKIELLLALVKCLFSLFWGVFKKRRGDNRVIGLCSLGAGREVRKCDSARRREWIKKKAGMTSLERTSLENH